MLLFVSVVLVACGSGSDPNNTGKNNDKGNSGEASDEITVWAWDPKFNIAALEIAKEVYAEENSDLEVKVIENAQDDIVQKLNTALGSGTTKGLPNITLLEDYRAQSFLQAFPDLFYDLTDVFDANDFADYKITPTSFEGKNYGIPFDTGSTGLYVRTDYLEEAGYTVEDLQEIDWYEYIEIGKAVKDATGKAMLTQDPNDLGILRMMMQSAGSWYMEDDGVTPYLEGNDALKESLEIYKAMIDEDILRPHSDWSELLAGFNSGEAASIPTGNWITPSVKAEESQADNWVVVPIPKLTVSGSTNASNLGGSSFYVFDIPGAEEAAEFLSKTFGSDVDMYERLVDEVGALGTYTPVLETGAYEKSDEFFGGQQIFADFAEWMEEIPEVNYGMHTYAIEDIMKVELQNYLNGKDVEDVLKDAQKQAESQL